MGGSANFKIKHTEPLTQRLTPPLYISNSHEVSTVHTAMTSTHLSIKRHYVGVPCPMQATSGSGGAFLSYNGINVCAQEYAVRRRPWRSTPNQPPFQNFLPSEKLRQEPAKRALVNRPKDIRTFYRKRKFAFWSFHY